MAISKIEFSSLVKEFKFRELFNRLGWNNDKTTHPIVISNYTYQLQSVATKSGFRILVSSPDDKGRIPDYVTRKKIDNSVTKLFQEHLLIFINEKRDEQLWQYIIKRQGKPAKANEIRYNIGQAPELLYQKTSGLFFTLEDEENITIVDVNEKFHKSFNVNAEKITKKFYDGFKKVHTEFVNFIIGINDKIYKDWYASLMLNRLMFCYFIQKKGFLDNNKNYLREKLIECQRRIGEDRFYTFYKNFLLELFQKGLGGVIRTPELVTEIGKIPYLNGGLFDIHEIEQKYAEIDISDEAFEKIFDFFDQYEWHLDTSKDATGKEINPDVIGYIFEKYINDRAQMGAYYTQEDITEYISKNCILPHIFCETIRLFPEAFLPDSFIWQLLKNSGDKYIHESVKQGAELSLPESIEKGVDIKAPELLERRKDWNKAATSNCNLNYETWREVIERRTKYFELRKKINNGNITCIKEFVTHNLDIRQFAQDIIESIDDADFIWLFYKTMNDMTILDPTCGSGAFLFAALNILEPLYESCIMRMRQYIDESDKPRRYKNFEKVIDEIDQEIHPSQEYYIYKSIILKNLYGVDIMKEAVETAKLRLFLKLVAAVEADYKKENLGLEPLPDIDFNIKAGNTLTGYANEKELDEALSEKIDGVFLKGDIKEKCLMLERANNRYKAGQLEYGFGFADFKEAKKDLNNRRKELNNMLNKLYAGFGAKDYEKWLITHQPFHWYAEFYDIVAVKGGFDVIIGNPPYVEYSKIRNQYKVVGYQTEECGNIYAFMSERSLNLLQNNGSFGYIVPISLVCTQRMKELQRFIEKNSSDIWFSNYAERPSKLFVGAEVLLTIVISILNKTKSANLLNVFSTGFIKWTSDERDELFKKIWYIPCNTNINSYIIPKFSSSIELSIIRKMMNNNDQLGLNMLKKSNHPVYYRIGGGRYWKIFTNFQPKFILNGKASISSRENYLFFDSEEQKDAAVSILSSSLFYWYFILTTNCRDLNPSDLKNFPINLIKLKEKTAILATLCSELMTDYKKNSELKEKTSKQTGIITYQEFYPRLSKSVINKIDEVLANYYNFTEEEFYYITNYDIKYRMGVGSDDDE